MPFSSAGSLIEANPTDSLIAFHRKMQVELIDSLAIIINTVIFLLPIFRIGSWSYAKAHSHNSNLKLKPCMRSAAGLASARLNGRGI